MNRPFRITATMLFTAITFLVAGELASGTHPEFVAMMAGTMLCIAVTFNLLGGLKTISGIGFTGFALCTIVISQFAKVLFFEAADKNLEAPYLTIKVYLVCLLYTSITTQLPGFISAAPHRKMPVSQLRRRQLQALP